MQRELVDAELARLAGLARALDRTIATVEQGNNHQEETMFIGFDPCEYEDEAREGWGHTDAYKDSARRTASYGKAEWDEIKAQAQEIERRLAELKRSGQPADGEPARAAAEQARLHIDRWFYPCSHELQRALGEMYVADPRFAANYEKVEPGLAVYVRDAIIANASGAETHKNPLGRVPTWDARGTCSSASASISAPPAPAPPSADCGVTDATHGFPPSTTTLEATCEAASSSYDSSCAGPGMPRSRRSIPV